MKSITIEFWRIGAAAGTSGEAAVKAHQDRAALLRGMKDVLGIEKINLDAAEDENPSEIVEVIIALTPVVVPALAALIKLWIDSQRLEKVRIVRPSGTTVEIGSGTPKQIASVLQSVAG